MGEEQRRILDLLAEGKITPDEAERLLAALAREPGGEGEQADAGGKSGPKHLRVTVEGREGRQVNVRVPIALVRAGMKLGALVPERHREQVDAALGKHGLSLEGLLGDPRAADELADALAELNVEADEGGEKVRVYCE